MLMARTKLEKNFFSEDYTRHSDRYAKTITPKESKYSWLIKHGRDGMTPVHPLPLLRFVIAQ